MAKEKITLMIRLVILIIAFQLFSNAYSQDWKWKNPFPTGNKLYDVEFVDSITAFAVGSKGTILKTTNRGLDWKSIESKIELDLFDLTVIDKDTLYICAENINVFKSTDGGISWENVFDNGWSDNYNILFFVNPEVGYVAGDGINLYKTIDNGKTWNEVDVNGSLFQSPHSLYFTSVDTGYAAISNSKILKTTDGGENWSQLSIPLTTNYNKIYFLNDSIGFALGGGDIIKTTDAGDSWTVPTLNPPLSLFSSFYSIEFISDSIGFLGGSGNILKTTNGGNVWDTISTLYSSMNAIKFADSLHGIIVGGSYGGGIFITENSGDNWTQISSSVTYKSISEIKFVNSDTGYVIGSDVSATYSGYILKTEDAGNTWSALNTGVNNYGFYDIALLGKDTIYIVAENGQILKSTDAGMTWSEQNSNTSNDLYVVSFINSNWGYAAGEEGTIIKTIDGGVTWVNQESLTIRNLYTLFFKDINTGYIAYHDYSTDSTYLLTTTDGGENWNKKYISTLRNPRTLYFVNNDTAFIGGDFGGILRTMDGGDTWKSSYQHGNSYFDIFFTDKNTGYIVGEDGEISMTQNCGDDWTVLKSNTEIYLRSVFFTDENTGYVVGSDGTILKTTNSGSKLKSLYQSSNSICHGDTVAITPNFIGGTRPLTYSWDNGQSSHSISVSPDSETTYNVTIVDFEKDSIKIEIPVFLRFVPTPTIHLSGDTLISNYFSVHQWYRNDTLVADANSYKLVAESNGDYYSILQGYECSSDKSNIISVKLEPEILSPTNNSNSIFNFYPNPVNHNLNIEFHNLNNPYLLKIIGINGREFISLSSSEDEMQLDLQNIPEGLYFIQLISNDLVITEKIFKN